MGSRTLGHHGAVRGLLWGTVGAGARTGTRIRADVPGNRQSRQEEVRGASCPERFALAWGEVTGQGTQGGEHGAVPQHPCPGWPHNPLPFPWPL